MSRRDAEKFEDERAAEDAADAAVGPKLADIVACGRAQFRFSDTVGFLVQFARTTIGGIAYLLSVYICWTKNHP